MNQKIRELMEQTVISIDGHTFGKTHIPDEFTEKFAELMVREFVEICNKAIMQNQETVAKVDSIPEKMIAHGAASQAYKLGEVVIEYFGVEK